MTALPIDALAAAAQWTAVRADGVTPSTDIAIHDETVVVGEGPDGVAVRVTATAGAGGHALRRSIPAVDISGHTELRLSIRADRAAGHGGAPFFLELRLGSAAVPLGDPDNHWHRLLPVGTALVWESVRLSTHDLDPGVATAVNAIQLRCVATGRPFTVYLDDLVAVRPQMLADTDRAVVDRLSGISLAGQAVPVAVRAAGDPLPDAPAIDIVHIDLRFAPARVRDTRRLQDFTTEGARMVPPGAPYDIDYAVSAVADSRAGQAALIEAVVDRLAPADELTFHSDRLPVDLVWISRRQRLATGSGPDPVLHYRVEARSPSAAGQPVRDVREVEVFVDQEAA
ncbi:hypothetical protein [Phytohabitans rumicis]|nr:hypothetical protein [Phytohabitans rumicis]